MSDNALTPKKAFFRILPVIIAVVIILVIAIVVTSVKSSTPNPTISDPDKDYLAIGEYKVSRDRLYTYLKKDYGVFELTRLVDEELLKDITVSDQEFKEYLIESMFNVDYDSNYDYFTGNELNDVKDYDGDAKETWDDSVRSLQIYGILDPKDVNDADKVMAAFRSYFEVDAKRLKYAKQAYAAELAEAASTNENKLAFTDKEINDYYEENYKGTSVAIVIPFSSSDQALKALEANGVNIDSSLLKSAGWVKASYNPYEAESETNVKEYLTIEEVLNVFTTLYNEQVANVLDDTWYTLETVDGTTTIKSVDFSKFEEDSLFKFEYTNEELKAIDDKVASQLAYDEGYKAALSNSSKLGSCYSYSPVSGTNYTFLMIKLDEAAAPTIAFDQDYEELSEDEKKSVDALKDEIVAKLTEEGFVDNYVSKYNYENRTNSKFVIMDRYLNAVYNYNYDYFFTTTLGVSDYKAYNTTKKTSKTVVATFEHNGTKEITADALFNSMDAKFTVMEIGNMFDDYQLLSNKSFNKIYNPYTGEEIDAAKFKELLTTEVANIKKNFDYGYFTNSTLAYYGFIPAFPSSYGWVNFRNDYFGAFSDQELVTNPSFSGTAYTDAKALFEKTFYNKVDEVISAIRENYNDYFSTTVMNLVISLDNNYDGSADMESDDWNDENRALAVELANLFKELAPQTGKATLSEQMTELVNLYKKASIYEDESTSTSIYVHNYFAKFIKAGLKVKWETSSTYTSDSSIVEAFADKCREAFKLLGAGRTLTAPYFIEPFETEYGYHLVAVSATGELAELPENMEFIIGKYMYTQLLDSEKASDHDTNVTLTTEEQSFIDTWYSPVVTEKTASDIVGTVLVEARIANVGLIDFKNNDNLEKQYNIMNEVLLESYSEEK